MERPRDEGLSKRPKTAKTEDRRREWDSERPLLAALRELLEAAEATDSVAIPVTMSVSNAYASVGGVNNAVAGEREK